MNSQNPIYTELTRCQDCYKCVRACPVKAIRVEDERAAVEAARCVYCGTCVNVCPVGAKKVRDDLGRARLLMRRRERVVLSLAPSWVTEWPGVRPGQMVRALKLLGFAAVSETALGAEEVSAACGALLDRAGRGVFISTACPSVVDYIRKFRPGLARFLVPYLSPMLAHAQVLRRELGDDIGVVFLGPCIAKKTEADDRPELVDVVLTYPSLHRWFEEAGIVPSALQEGPEDELVPRRAGQGVLYPMDGGMNRGISASGHGATASLLASSGMGAVEAALEGLEDADPEPALFLELLACEGGCVNGPRAARAQGTALKRLAVERGLDEALPVPVQPEVDLRRAYPADPVELPAFHEAEIQKALRRLGKSTPEDELNCGGCGYDTCRNLARALLEGRAETSMCVSYMRKLAMNKANALIRAMPSGFVIVDENLEIVECNRRFAEVLGGDTVTVYDARPGMAGASLAKVAPFQNLFADALDTEEEVLSRDVRLGGRVVRLTVFPIEREHLVGGILHDITEPAFQRDQIIQKAEEVIRKNVTTVQQIAYLLGENAAETEMTLDSIIDSFRLVPPGAPEQREG